jgi:hypothetical protein
MNSRECACYPLLINGVFDRLVFLMSFKPKKKKNSSTLGQHAFINLEEKVHTDHSENARDIDLIMCAMPNAARH